jgi:hypothetical protein
MKDFWKLISNAELRMGPIGAGKGLGAICLTAIVIIALLA